MAQNISKYDTLWSADDPDGEQSETDVEDGREKRWQSTDMTTRKGTKAQELLITLSAHRWLIDTCLLLVIIGLLTILLLGGSRRPSPRQIGGDYTGSSPEFDAKVVKWNADESFVPTNISEWFSDSLLAKWNTIMPLDASQSSAKKEAFSTTSMTHSLHCIFMIGRIFSAVLGNTTDVLADDYLTHYMHCTDYLRQAIMCAGDMAMEPHVPTDGPDNGPLDGGWNGIHVCKDYSQVINYLEGQIEDGVRVVLPIED
ncbi:hypothetical protein VPNG_06670 [Cytospora leucostoma]|uniref:Oxidase ustYa n=1 Tax=Cytospora leucostoma TaxID=1230097 RepID=A0A423WU28_9PEZI|nr:hypothetical protein VPNG_06670 [Cytospora leucostoma]